MSREIRLGVITKHRHFGGRNGWIVSDLRNEGVTITNSPDGRATWTDQLQIEDRVAVIRTSKSQRYQDVWVGKLAHLEQQSPELQNTLSDRLRSPLPQFTVPEHIQKIKTQAEEVRPVTKTYLPGDRVVVDINAGINGDERNWRLATVTHPTNVQYGWTMARTDCGLERGPGWLPDEIQPIDEPAFVEISP